MNSAAASGETVASAVCHSSLSGQLKSLLVSARIDDLSRNDRDADSSPGCKTEQLKSGVKSPCLRDWCHQESHSTGCQEQPLLGRINFSSLNARQLTTKSVRQLLPKHDVLMFLKLQDLDNTTSGAKTKLKMGKEDSDYDFLYSLKYVGCSRRLKDANSVWFYFFFKGHMRCLR